MRAKFIYEKFTHDSDPIKDLGISPYKLIEEWLEKYQKCIGSSVINPDYTINVSTTLNFYDEIVVEFPEYINFYSVEYDISFYNSRLISLRGFPKYVGRNVYLGNNKLTSLKGLPINGDANIIYGDLMIFDNKLKSLKGCPERVNGSFHCGFNPLKSLDGMPKYIGKNFICFPPTFKEDYIKKYLKDHKIFIGGLKIINRKIAEEEHYHVE